MYALFIINQQIEKEITMYTLYNNYTISMLTKPAAVLPPTKPTLTTGNNNKKISRKYG